MTSARAASAVRAAEGAALWHGHGHWVGREPELEKGAPDTASKAGMADQPCDDVWASSSATQNSDSNKPTMTVKFLHELTRLWWAGAQGSNPCRLAAFASWMGVPVF